MPAPILPSSQKKRLVMVVQIVGLSLGEKNPQKNLSSIILEYSYLFYYDTATMLVMVV